jgi:hypothetical protein
LRAQIFLPNAVVLGCCRFHPSKVTILHGHIVRSPMCDSTFFPVDLLSTVRLWWKNLVSPIQCSSLSFSDLPHMIWSDLVALYCQKKDLRFLLPILFIGASAILNALHLFALGSVRDSLFSISSYGRHISCRLHLQIGLCDAKCPYSPTRLFRLQVDLRAAGGVGNELVGASSCCPSAKVRFCYNTMPRLIAIFAGLHFVCARILVLIAFVITR